MHYLLDYMKNKGGILISKKREDIAYYSEKDKKFLLRYNQNGNYDKYPVVFDEKYISTFKEDKNLNQKLKISKHFYRQKEEPKQVIIINKSLNMSPGKLAAQVAHASLGALFESANYRNKNKICLEYEDDSSLELWINKRFTKIVLYVKSEEKLINILNKAKNKGLPSVIIEDAGFTEFNKPTKTCVGIGPVFPKELIGITNKLRIF